VNQRGPLTNSQTDPKFSESQTTDPQMVEMLAGMNATADMMVVQRTRRAVMQAAAELREQQRRTRRNMAVVLLTVTVLAMVLTPAIWSTVDDFLGGERWFELPGMVMVLVLLLFSTIVAALIIGFKGQQQMHGRR
jgi:cytochrome bd-type quinol oxidase subunit 2